MRKNIVSIAFLLIAAAWLAGVDAFGLGIGPYVDAFGGESDRTVTSRALESTGGKVTNYGVRAGLVFDTCVACDQVFNYRLKVGGGRSRSEVKTKADLNSFHMGHTFAFAAVSNDLVRFWVGPTLAFSYYRGAGHRLAINAEYPGPTYLLAASAGVVPSPAYLGLFDVGIFNNRFRYTLYRGDAGLAFGANLNLGDYVALVLEAGVTYGYGVGTQNRELYFARGPIMPYHKFKDRLRDHGVEGYGSFAFMFRFADTFQ